jgi:hypothetical protein
MYECLLQFVALSDSELSNLGKPAPALTQFDQPIVAPE